jgi:aerobic C4-dicarboxylate transport protein
MGTDAMVGMVAEGQVPRRKPFDKQLYVQVLAAIVLGFLLGWLMPEIAKQPWVKALGDGFIKLIKMVIAPIIFCTVTSGIAHMDNAR